jgi:hypothetical protein
VLGDGAGGAERRDAHALLTVGGTGDGVGATGVGDGAGGAVEVGAGVGTTGAAATTAVAGGATVGVRAGPIPATAVRLPHHSAPSTTSEPTASGPGRRLAR